MLTKHCTASSPTHSLTHRWPQASPQCSSARSSLCRRCSWPPRDENKPGQRVPPVDRLRPPRWAHLPEHPPLTNAQHTTNIQYINKLIIESICKDRKRVHTAYYSLQTHYHTSLTGGFISLTLDSSKHFRGRSNLGQHAQWHPHGSQKHILIPFDGAEVHHQSA
jgi:hypothetical protein